MNQTLKALVIACAGAACLQGCVPLVVAGAATGVAATVDRRSYGTQVEDSEIEVRVMGQINKQLDEKASISTTSLNKWVLLTGQTPDEASRQQAEKIATSTPNVRRVYNEVTVGWPSTVGNHASDSLTTSQVKSRLFNPNVPGISGHNVKVVTEFGVVYMMGLVTEAEAKLAVDIARSTSGVKRVVNLLEVLSDEEMRRLEGKTAAPVSTPPK